MFQIKSCGEAGGEAAGGMLGTAAISKTAADLYPSIQEFLDLSDLLHLTLCEEYTLVTIAPSDWNRWRSLSVPPAALASALLVRRLNYALALLRRMAAVAYPERNWPRQPPPSSSPLAGVAQNDLSSLLI